MKSLILSNRLPPDVENFPLSSASPVIPLDILPFYLAYRGYIVVGMNNLGRLIVQPRSTLQLEKAVKATQSGD